MSENEIFWNFHFQNQILSAIIMECLRWYKWCWKEHSIIVAELQQKCCFSAPNVDFSWLFTLVHKKLDIKRKNNICCRKTTFLVKMSNSDVLLVHPSFIAPWSSKTLSDALLNILTHVLEGFFGNLPKKLKNEFL